MKLDPITEFILTEQDNNIEVKIVNDLRDNPEWNNIEKDLIRLFNLSIKDDNEYLKKNNMKQRKWGDKEFFERLKFISVICFSAFLNNKPVGLVFLLGVGSQAQIQDLIVDPKFRNKGVASTLLDTVMKYCKEKKIKQIILNVWDDNDKAKNLYKKHGFKSMYVFMKKVL